MRDVLEHRGPDAAGAWCSADGRVAFGHRRLAIIDLSDRAAQPMSDSTGRLQIIFNGEIYNYRELRQELRARNVSFVSDSDTEVILAAYRAWGDACLVRFNGMFVIAIHDAERGCVLLARDRAGKKPLFYAHTPGRLLFASELKSLMQHPAIERRLDPEAADHYFTYGYVPGDRCLLQGIHKLPQGHKLTYSLDTDRLEVASYWRLPDPANLPGDVNELEAELYTLLVDAVRLRLIADVPVGILLSGGLDSSLITAAAVQCGAARIRTFNVAFPGHGALDEGPYARRVAEYFGTEHSELEVPPSSGVDTLLTLARQFDEPIGDQSIIPMYLLSREVRRSVTVALGGDGGDELFGGYPHHSFVQRIERMRGRIPGVARAVAAAAAHRLPVGTRGRNHVIALRGTLADSLAHINLYFDVNTRARLLAPLLSGRGTWPAPEQVRAAMVTGQSVLQSSTRLDFMTTMVDDYLVKVDRASMLASLEVRAPFLDYRLIEFAYARVPSELRATERERKVLLRRLAARLLPPDLDLRRKQGFVAPLDGWLRNEWRDVVADVVAGLDPQIFARPEVARLVALHDRGFANAQRIFALLMFELWRREYRVTAS